ncbi:MAG TPA: hypothetical protein VK647_08095 [Gemmatimonadales bacterium]|nr:hypothetical protein [Gemmatimonadales bacterium]
MIKLAAAATAVLVALSVATACRAQSPADTVDAMDSTDQHATHAAQEAMSGSMSMDPHMTLSQVLPGVKQPIYHFTSCRWALRATRRFDPTKPTSLLYREGPGGTLAGAMYTAPARTELDALDQRIPLSVARWHEHVNWCLPPGGQRERWRETRDGKPLFGPKSPIATAEACAAVDGRFVPRLFGWMVHVMAFESGNPTVVWGMEHDHKPE